MFDFPNVLIVKDPSTDWQIVILREGWQFRTPDDERVFHAEVNDFAEAADQKASNKQAVIAIGEKIYALMRLLVDHGILRLKDARLLDELT